MTAAASLSSDELASDVHAVSATVLRFSPRTSIGVRSASASGPAIAIRVSSSSLRIQGTIDP